MKIKFHDTRKNIRSEWASDSVPRIGEWVDLGDDGHGIVRGVFWHFADSRGRPLSDRHVAISLGDPFSTKDDACAS